MIEGGADVEVVTVDGRETGFRVKKAGIGFSLQPVSGTARFPVHVYLDDAAEPVVVQSPAWQGDTVFSKLRVDVTPSGGRPGDEWRLQLRPTVSDGERQRPRTNAEGFLSTRLAGARVLFDIDSRTDAGRVAFAVIGDSEGTIFYINPDDPTQFSETMGDGFDVSETERVLFVVEQADYAAQVALWDFVPKVLGSATSDSLPLTELKVGTEGQFGDGAVPNWDRVQGYLMLGAPGSSSGASWATNPSYFPALRFKLDIPFDNTTSEYWLNTYGLDGYYMRLMAVAY